jgi:hypothetical protein
MTPEELKVKIDEVRTLIVEKLAELEEDPKWGSEEEREELADALEELITREVFRRGADCVDLRILCNDDRDFANPIESAPKLRAP